MNTPAVTDIDNNNNEIPSLLVPMVDYKLVLPTVSVAEMIPYREPGSRQPLATDSPAPDWYLGNLEWRSAAVPMISLELLNGETLAPIQAQSQVLILNNTGVSAQLPFLCLPTQGIPRLSRVAANEIAENRAAVKREYDEMAVFVAGEQAVIPAVGKLEQVTASLLGYL